MEDVVEFVARDESRALESASKLSRGAGGRYDNHFVGGFFRRMSRAKLRDGVAKGVQVGDAHELRPARCDHLSCGGRSNVWMSPLALAPSISAPAAADEASQARAMSPARVASRRISAAWPASWTALISSA